MEALFAAKGLKGDIGPTGPKGNDGSPNIRVGVIRNGSSQSANTGYNEIGFSGTHGDYSSINFHYPRSGVSDDGRGYDKYYVFFKF